MKKNRQKDCLILKMNVYTINGQFFLNNENTITFTCQKQYSRLFLTIIIFYQVSFIKAIMCYV